MREQAFAAARRPPSADERDRLREVERGGPPATPGRRCRGGTAACSSRTSRSTREDLGPLLAERSPTSSEPELLRRARVSAPPVEIASTSSPRRTIDGRGPVAVRDVVHHVHEDAAIARFARDRGALGRVVRGRRRTRTRRPGPPPATSDVRPSRDRPAPPAIEPRDRTVATTVTSPTSAASSPSTLPSRTAVSPITTARRPRAPGTPGRRTASLRRRLGRRATVASARSRSDFDPSRPTEQWMPHSLSVSSSHHQRPARSDSPGRIGRVHGAQPIDV